MQKLQVFICGNNYPEFQAALQKEHLEDVELHAYPPLCIHRNRKDETQNLLNDVLPGQGLLICSRSCEIRKMLTDNRAIQQINGSYCFSCITSDDFINYLLAQGNYIISSGWLANWENHIAEMGLDKQTARKLFKETCRQLVFLDADLLDNAEWLLQDLASFTGLPYIRVPISLDITALLLKSKVYEWRLQNFEQKNSVILNELRNQCADYSAVLDMLGKISTLTSKRDVVGKIKELFLMVFGAQKFTFISSDSEAFSHNLAQYTNLKPDNYQLLKEENRFLIQIEWDGIDYGILDVSDFIFPQYVEKYLNLAIEISKFCGLVLHNNDQYEKILKSEKELKEIIFYDTLTGLHNRAYISPRLKDLADDNKTIVFIFDIDHLKIVNDQHGHAEGDRLIIQFARIARKCFRETDIVARIGGDEFIAILHDADQNTAEEIRQRILEMIRTYNDHPAADHLCLSVSIGYAQRQNDKETIEDVMKRADEKMYADKLRNKSSCR